MKKGKARKPECHPNRKHYAKGLCGTCYNAELKRKRKKQPVKHEPVVVTHTHEVIRQVQQEEPKMAVHEHDKVKEIKRPEGASKEAVVSDVGATEPPTVFGGDGITPIAEWEESQKERREKQAEFDEKRRKQAVEDSGIIQTTAKHGIGAKHNG